MEDGVPEHAQVRAAMTRMVMIGGRIDCFVNGLERDMTQAVCKRSVRGRGRCVDVSATCRIFRCKFGGKNIGGPWANRVGRLGLVSDQIRADIRGG